MLTLTLTLNKGSRNVPFHTIAAIKHENVGQMIKHLTHVPFFTMELLIGSILLLLPVPDILWVCTIPQHGHLPSLILFLGISDIFSIISSAAFYIKRQTKHLPHTDAERGHLFCHDFYIIYFMRPYDT
jgi:hypothetical protein